VSDNKENTEFEDIEKDATPWVTGCILPLIIALVFVVAAVYGVNRFLLAEEEVVEVTPTVRTVALRATATVLGQVEFTSTELSTPDCATMFITVGIKQDGQALANEVPIQFTITINEEDIGQVGHTVNGLGLYTLSFTMPPVEEEPVFEVSALINNELSASRTIRWSDSCTERGNYGISVPPIIAKRAKLRDIYVEAVQVDAKGSPRIRVYFIFVDGNGDPVLLPIDSNVEVLQDDTVVIVDDNSWGVVGDEGLFPLISSLVVDVSGSMEGEPIIAAREAAMSFVVQLNPQDSACLYSFATLVNLVQDCTTSHAEVIGAISKLVTIDDTSLYDALIRVSNNQGQREGRQAIIVLSDGNDTVSQASLEEAQAQMKRSQIPFYLIGLISEQFDGAILQQLADATEGIYLESPSVAELQLVYSKAKAQLDNQYYVEFDSVYPERSSGLITIRFKDGKDVLEIIREYSVEQ
jgi:uncharacterized protein YegL